MKMKLRNVVSFVIGAMALLLLDCSARATQACAHANASCLQGMKTGEVQDGPVLLAQAPATVARRSKVVIKKPNDDIARNAFEVLDTHCARCHQAGRLERERPAKNFGNILQLDEIARDPHLIRPGNPDGSRLFSRIVKQEMPYDIYTEFSGGREPSKEDVQAIYDWIESLDAKTVASCSNRKPVSTEQVVNSISSDLNKQSANRRAGMRYLTLTNHYNACASSDEISRMRNGATVLLNSLSRARKTVRPSVLGRAQTIMAINLNDLGWSAADWDTLLSAYPYGARPKSRTFDQVKSLTKTPLAYLRADWFAAAASRPPLYYKLLNLPEELASLQSELGVDAEQNRADGNALRAGFDQSTATRYNRMVERHDVGNGYLWMSFDFNGTDTRQNIKKHPLGPEGEKGFEHDLNAVLFSLPNGMNAFFLSDSDGQRIDRSPTDILYNEATPRRPVIVGLTCMSCHASGVLDAVDEVRAQVEASSSFSPEQRDQVDQLYGPQGDLDRRIKDDRKRYRNASASVGIRLERGDDGLDDLSLLVRSYEKNLDLRIAAAENGVTTKQYEDGMNKAGEEAQRTKQELEQGTMARRLYEPLHLTTVVAVAGDVPVGQVKAPTKIPAKPALARVKKAPKPKPAKAKVSKKKPAPKKKVAAVTPNDEKPANEDKEITLVSDKVRYRANDLPVFTVNASQDCNLTLINVDPAGRAVVIFPNKYQQENFIQAGSDFEFPGSDAPFQFRLKDIGKEKVVAECAAKGDGDRIEHNFDQQEFTDLGDYRDHVGEQAEKEGGKKSSGSTRANLLRTAITFTVR